MLTLAEEREHLAKANRDIGEGERRVAAQQALIVRLRQEGHPVEQAERLLTTLRETLAAWIGHREEIARMIARLEDEKG